MRRFRCVSAGRFLLVTGALVLALFALAGCGAQRGAADKGVVYTVADPTGDWGFPSPFAHYPRGPGYIRMHFLFDTLVWKDEKGFVPALAESWQYLKDENAYVFRLRKDVTWHDGRKFTARDVVFTVDYLQKNRYQWTDVSIVARAEALDDYTVKLVLARPHAPFMNNFAATVPIIPEHVWQGVTQPEQFTDPRAAIGTGPFKFVDYNKEQGTYLYEANPHYYGGRPKVAQLRFVKINAEVVPAALRQKQVNAAQVPPEVVGDLEKEGFTVIKGAHDWVAKLMINHTRPPLDNPDFRRALAHAVDRQALVDTCLRGHGLPGGAGLLAPDNPWYNPQAELYPYDPARTAEILTGLGYVKKGQYFEKDGRVLELELLVSGEGVGVPGSPREREAEMIKSQLEKAGIKVNLRGLEAKTLDQRVGEWKFDLALSGHGGIGGDPEILNRVILGQSFLSARYDRSGELNELLKRQLSAMDPEVRKSIVARIQEVYAREMPALPLYHPTWYWAHDGKVNLFYTYQGVGTGVPIPLNKLAFVR